MNPNSRNSLEENKDKELVFPDFKSSYKARIPKRDTEVSETEMGARNKPHVTVN